MITEMPPYPYGVPLEHLRLFLREGNDERRAVFGSTTMAWFAQRYGLVHGEAEYVRFVTRYRDYGMRGGYRVFFEKSPGEIAKYDFAQLRACAGVHGFHLAHDSAGTHGDTQLRAALLIPNQSYENNSVPPFAGDASPAYQAYAREVQRARLAGETPAVQRVDNVQSMDADLVESILGTIL